MSSGTDTTGEGRSRTARVVALGLAGAAVSAGLLALAFVLRGGDDAAVDRSVLRLERRVLGTYLDETFRTGETLVPHGGLLVTMDEEVIRRTLERLLPWEGEFGVLRVRLDRARTRLGRGLAVVDLEGTAVNGGSPEIAADVALAAALYVDRVDETSGALRTRIEVLGLRAVRGSGERGGPVRRALDGAAEQLFAEVSRLLGRVELPLLLEHDLELPAVDDDDVTIPAARLPLALGIRRVLVLDGRIWVSLEDRSVAAEPSPRRPDDGNDAEGRRGPGGGRCGASWLDRLRPRCPSGRELRDAEWLGRRVATLNDSVTLRLRADPAASVVLADSGNVVARVDARLIEALVSRGTGAYLDSLELHISGAVDVDEEGEVTAGLGPLDIGLGSWTVRATIREIEAVLRAEAPVVEVTEPNRLSLRIPVRTGRARGRVRLRFRWDAGAVPGLLCEDFEFDRTFEATVPAARHEVVGYFEFRNEGGRLLADPEQTNEVRIRPEPEPAAWQAVRQTLAERDGVFDCGLGLDPDALERRLRARLDEGFEFGLPESMLRPIPIPLRIGGASGSAAGRDGVTVRPLTLELGSEALQYSVRISSGG